MAHAAEGAARRYLRPFPEWMRADRGEEAVGLVLDLVPDDAERLPLGSRLDLVRAGLHARRRGAPPLRVWDAVAGADLLPASAAQRVVRRVQDLPPPPDGPSTPALG